MRASTYIAAGSLAAVASAQNYLGFSTGSTTITGSAKVQSDYETEFKTAQGLIGAPGVFSSARLYTNIQGGSTQDPIEAFPAAIATKTSLLLGIWTSGTTSIDKELAALKTALDKYGKELADLVIGISIGSEDLYRNSVDGVKNDAGIGADPDVIVGFIDDYRKAFKGTLLKDVPVGHVDTWNVFTNSSNQPVIDAVDWVGLDEYPYYESGKGNSIDNAAKLFKTAYDAASAAVGGKTVWVTETGWPYTGITWDEGVASVANAKKFWDEVGCDMLFNKVPTFWYDLTDDNAGNKQSFAISEDLSTTPRFDLSCPKNKASSSASSSVPASTKASTKAGEAKTSTAAGGSASASGAADSSAAAGTSTAAGGASGSDSTATAAPVSSATGAAGSGSGSGSGSSASAKTSAAATKSGSAATATGTSIGTATGSTPTSTVVTAGASAVRGVSAVALAVAAFAYLL